MKMSKREKWLLIMLGVVILGYLFYTYLLTPQLQQLDVSKTNLQLKESTLSYAKLQANPNNKIFSEYKSLNAKVANATKGYFPVINQEKLILILEDMIKESNVNAISITFTEPGMDIPKEQPSQSPFATDTDPILQRIKDEISGKVKPQNNEVQAEISEENQPYQLSHMSANIAIEGTYSEIYQLVYLIESYEKKIVINNLSLASTETSMLAGSIGLDFYAIPKLHEQDQDYFNWDLTDVYGKTNPFGQGVAPSQGAGSPIIKSSPQGSDLTLVVSPILSDLPSVVLGKSKDSHGDSQVYADNAGKEAVEIQLSQANGKYYLKYKTSAESYPQDYSSNGIAFTPNSSAVILQAVSAPRTGAQDQSGVNISIVNNTDLEFIMNITNDDAKNSRVNVVKKTGKVTINR